MLGSESPLSPARRTQALIAAFIGILLIGLTPSLAHAWTAERVGATLIVHATDGTSHRLSLVDLSSDRQIADGAGNNFSGPLPSGCSAPAGNRLLCAGAGIGRIELHGGDADDRLTNSSTSVQAALFGGDGADTLTGTTGADLLDGGSGEDNLAGGGGDDTLDGGAGRDVLDGGDGDDTIRGGDGDDILDGGSGHDELFGDAGDDGLSGGDGNDTIDGGDGRDEIDGASGSDHLASGDGEDTLRGGAGADELLGGDGADELLGGDSVDLIDAGAGNDQVSAGNGADTVSGGPGDDQLDGGEGSDILDGGEANDTLNAGASDDRLIGGEGTDRLTGDTGNDVLDGSTGADQIYGGEGNDELNGEEGDDLLSPGAGSDRIQGGDGTDTATYADSSLDLSLSLNGRADDGAPGEADDLASDLEAVIGGSGNDRIAAGADAITLDGGPGDDVLTGSPADDSLLGGLGDDILDGAGGADLLDGGHDIDTAAYLTRTAGVTVTLDGQANDGETGEGDDVRTENVLGGSGPDVLKGSPLAANVLDGGAGDDQLIAEGSAAGLIDSAICGAGNDLAHVDDLDYYAGDCERVIRAGVQAVPALPLPVDVLPDLPEKEPEPITGPVSRLLVLDRVATVTGQWLPLRLRCQRSGPGRCDSHIAVTVQIGGKRLAAGFVDVVIGRDRQRTVRLELTGRAVRQLSAAGRRGLAATLVLATNDADQIRRTTARIRLLPGKNATRRSKTSPSRRAAVRRRS